MTQNFTYFHLYFVSSTSIVSNKNESNVESLPLNQKDFKTFKLKRSSYLKNGCSDTDSCDNQWSDSGFKTNSKKNDEKPSTRSTVPKTVVPFTFTFVGGLFGLKLYRNSVGLG